MVFVFVNFNKELLVRYLLVKVKKKIGVGLDKISEMLFIYWIVYFMYCDK